MINAAYPINVMYVGTGSEQSGVSGLISLKRQLGIR